MSNTIDRFMSDIVLGGTASSDLGFSYLEASVTWSAALKAGSILTLTGTDYAHTVVAGTDAHAVLVDSRCVGTGTTATGTAAGFTVGTEYTLLIGLRGLTYNNAEISAAGDPSAAQQLVATNLLQALGNKVTSKVV